MKVLIELYDERVIENILSVETFRPEKVIYLAPEEDMPSEKEQNTCTSFFRERGICIAAEFRGAPMYETDGLLNELRKIYREEPDCVMDVSGGSDAALFAAGLFSGETDIPVFTYSRKQNRFYNIHHAPFADCPCTLSYNVSEFIRMAGGRLEEGRENRQYLLDTAEMSRALFRVFLKFRRKWGSLILWMQRISASGKDGQVSLHVSGAIKQKKERGGFVTPDEKILYELEKIGLIENLRLLNGSVSFDFKDRWTRFWLRDTGSALELHAFNACMDTGIFEDVVSSAVVSWDSVDEKDSVKNEIDAIATRGLVPMFLSCKATEVKTEALNELAILADRFGGKGAKPVILTSERCNARARHRAAQLGIAVIDLEELMSDKTSSRLRVIMKADKE